jgi:peptidoglycan/xylan/chitin deacetylase (PgdA/CDA1 family)
VLAALVRRSAKAAVMPAGMFSRRRPGDVVVLLYHRLGDDGSEIELSVAAFERHLARLAERDRPRSLEQALGGDGGVVVTFDDGTLDFHSHALPLLVRYKVPALLYLATGGVNTTAPDSLTWEHLAEAVATGLVTIGSHTHGHTDLSVATEEVADDEMRRSQGLIEDRLGVGCRHFAYPWGIGSPGADRAARRLFTTAALDGWRVNRAGAVDPYRLARIPILRSDGQVFFRAKVRGQLNGEALLYRAARRGPWRPK